MRKTLFYSASLETGRLNHWFLRSCETLVSQGNRVQGRNDMTYSMFGPQLEIDASVCLPLITMKRTALRPMVAECVAFLRGYSNSADFERLGCKFWLANATSDYWLASAGNTGGPGSLGRIYGVQWRQWRGVAADGSIKVVDQWKNLVDGLRKDPHGRRHIISAWNPAEFDQMALPPCHAMFQVYAEGDDGLSLKMYQRSADIFLGVPMNIASYGLILYILAAMTNRTPRKLILTFGDLHLYETHVTEDNVVALLKEVKDLEEPGPLVRLPNYSDKAPDDMEWLTVEDIMASFRDPEDTALTYTPTGSIITAKMVV